MIEAAISAGLLVATSPRAVSTRWFLTYGVSFTILSVSGYCPRLFIPHFAPKLDITQRHVNSGNGLPSRLLHSQPRGCK